MIVAIDHGNYAIKTPNYTFMSGLTSHTTEPPLCDEILKYDGFFWTITDRRISLQYDKTSDEQFFVLTLFAIAKEMKRENKTKARIDLAIGLPPMHYKPMRDKFKEYFMKDENIRFEFNGIPYCITINDVFVNVQGYSALLTQPQLARLKKMYVVDIGGGTVDVLLRSNGKFDTSIMKSYGNLGIISMTNDINNAIESEYFTTVNDSDIIDALLNGNDFWNDAMKSMIAEKVKAHAKKILDKLKEDGINMNMTQAVFVGGGSMLLKPYIEKSPLVTNPIFILDQNANAKGYETLARHQKRNG